MAFLKSGRQLTNSFCITLLAAAVLTPIPAAAAPCSSLTALTLPHITITSATDVTAGPFTRPGPANPEAATALNVPAFCRVIGVARPTSDSIINFEVWMPPAKAWNGKFLGVGNGAYYGSLSYGAMTDALRRGYATASTDTGHTGGGMKFVAGQPEKMIDWGYRAIHVTAQVAKLIVRDYYGNFPLHSYFRGCSTGGEQALSEAQRFPDDYDGLLVGDPGNDRTHLNAGFLWDFEATHKDGASILPENKLPVVNRAAVAVCDALDGVKDGIIADPAKCNFDPAILLCRGADTDNCLTAAQIDAVKKIYAGPRNPRTGKQIIPGYEPGSEDPGDPDGGWKAYITGLSEPKRLDFWRYWVFNDPNWNWRTFDFDRDMAYADKKLAAVNASSPDLSAFKSRGGRILMYDGWADPVGPPLDTVNYYENVTRAMGGPDKTTDFFRLFMAPGMAHCDSGPGPVPFGGAFMSDHRSISIDPEQDMLNALDRWVEHGSAPDHIVASHVSNGVVNRTGLLCPYPKVAKWNGTGSTDDAASFTCTVNKEP